MSGSKAKSKSMSIRIPESLYNHIHANSELHGTSMNAEILKYVVRSMGYRSLKEYKNNKKDPRYSNIETEVKDFTEEETHVKVDIDEEFEERNRSEFFDGSEFEESTNEIGM